MDNVVFEILTISMTNVYLNLTDYVLSGICFVIEYCIIQKVRGCLPAKLVDFKGTIGECLLLEIYLCQNMYLLSGITYFQKSTVKLYSFSCKLIDEVKISVFTITLQGFGRKKGIFSHFDKV